MNRPKWARPARMAPRCAACGRWLPTGRGQRDRGYTGHGPSCPSRFAYLTCAADVADARTTLMTWMAAGAHLGDVRDHRQVAEVMAAGISARAVELGLER